MNNQILDFSLDQLAMFVAVVDRGTFAEAGLAMGRSTSTVSAALARLEHALGVPLFERVGRRSVLTEQGERLATEARLAIAQAREVQTCAQLLAQDLEAHLTIAIDTVFPSPRLCSVLGEFVERFPTVPLRVLEDTLALRLVARGQADFGICNLAGSSVEGFDSRFCRNVELIPVCAATHSLASTNAPQPLSVLRRGIQIVLSERSDESHEDQGVLSPRTWRVTDLSTKLGLLRRGVGWGSVPLELIEDELDTGALVQLRPVQWPDGHVVALHSVVKEGTALGTAGTWLREALSR